MQWDMEELRRKSMEMEWKLNSKEDEKLRTELKKGSTNQEKDMALQELDATRKQLEDLSKRYRDMEAKSKADIKFLAKEFKTLKISETELKQELSKLAKEKSEIEKLLREDREMGEQKKNARKKLLHDCRVLHNRLQECSLNLSAEEDDDFVVNSSQDDVLNMLTTSEDQIGHLVAEVQLLAKDDKTAASDGGDDDLRNMVANIFADNAKLRKQVNTLMRRALQTGVVPRDNDEASQRKTNHLER
uniref:Phox domain-containing family protein n=1 Tax=Rhizophora mucronata TaxID=61149 RepID=A0A2P2IWI9_RHIMU